MATTLENLGRRGIVAFEVDGVLARLTKKSSANDAMRRKLVPVVTLVAVVAAHVRNRVRDKKKAASKWAGYSKRGKRLLPTKYRGALSAHYPSSAAIPRKGLASVTGAMWDNVEVVARGRDGGKIGFRGTSSGIGLTKPRRLGGLRFPVRAVFDQRVRNQTKANQLFANTRLHVLEPTFSENLAIADAIGSATANASVAFFGGRRAGPVRSAGADNSLRAKLLRVIGG